MKKPLGWSKRGVCTIVLLKKNKEKDEPGKGTGGGGVHRSRKKNKKTGEKTRLGGKETEKLKTTQGGKKGSRTVCLLETPEEKTKRRKGEQKRSTKGENHAPAST